MARQTTPPAPNPGPGSGLRLWLRQPANLLVLAAVLLPALLFGAVAAFDRTQATRFAERELLARLEALHAHAERVFQFQALAIGATEEVLSGLSDAEIVAAAPALHARLLALRRYAGSEIGIVVFDAAGRPLLESDRPPPPPPGVNVADRAYFLHHRDNADREPTVSAPVRSRANGSEVMFVTRRRAAADGSFAGIIAAGIRLELLLGTWGRVAPDAQSVVTLLRRDGTILARRPPLPPGAPTRFEPDGWVMQAARTLPPTEIASGLSPADGTERLFTFRGIERFPDLIISHGIGRQAALGPWRARLAVYGGFAAMASLALLLLALLARRRARAMEALNAGLEQRVEERTAEIRAGELRVRLLAREVDHRAKNLLAVVQATLRLTPKSNAATYAHAVEGRVAALARAQTLLSVENWRGADLARLAAAELAPFLAGGHGQVAMEGPEVRLPAQVVQPVAMALHELATNAVKHGALSVPGGRVRIAWTLAGTGAEDRVLALRWSETNGPKVAGAPEARGFGSRLLEGVVRGQLGGRLGLDYRPEGLRAELEVPLDRTTNEAAAQGSDEAA